MNFLSKEFIRDVRRVMTVEYLTTLLSSVFSPASHNHDSAYSPIGHNHDDRYYTETESDTLLASKSAISHLHDDRYYTETEVDTLLSDKSDVAHTHDTRYYTETEVDTALSAKLDSSSYTAADILSKTLTVDGSGSGLDADLLDGQEGSYYAVAADLTTLDTEVDTLNMLLGVEPTYVRRGIYKWSSSSALTNHYVHLKTNQTMNSIMVMYEFIGMAYRTGPIDAKVSFYPYGASSDTIQVWSYGSHTCGAYKSADGFAVITLLLSDTYYAGFILNQYGVTPQNLWPVEITAEAMSPSATGVY